MKTSHRTRRVAGFSLLEVLIAVVILSFGLLALAALQGSLFKTSAEAKAQSVGLALAAEKLEYFKGFLDLDAYQQITDGSDTVEQGGVNYTRTWTVDRYAYPVAGGSFTTVADTGTLASAYVANNEFKRVKVDVTWANADNASQRVSLEAAIAALNPGDSAKLAQLTGTTSTRGPEVRIFNPEKQQQGVIPIATGGGNETAATNPKPLINGSNVVETRFDVLTYNNVSADKATAVAQARVETSVVGCSCDYKGAKSYGGAKRPTYWDGRRYTVPEDATTVLGASFTALAGEDASKAGQQSELCTVCCRDHHDPAELPAGAAKFDPLNDGHKNGHYLLNTTSGALGTQTLAGKYTEVCRVIRVGGMYRVAADTYDDYQNFLATKSDGTKSAFLPDDSKTPTESVRYQNFVKAYLDRRVVNQSSQSNWNDVLPVKWPAVVTQLEAENQVWRERPAIDFAKTDTEKWLHLRGLYIDFLEPKALQAIQDAKDSCKNSSGGAPSQADLEACVLPVIPFTSINLTELGTYSPIESESKPLVVVNNDFYTTLSQSTPIRGRVSKVGDSPNGDPVNATGTMRRSNSGLTTLKGGIDPEDNGNDGVPPDPEIPGIWVATQPYNLLKCDPSTETCSSAASFYVNLLSYPFSVDHLPPKIGDSLGGICNFVGSTANNYSCSTSTFNQARTLTFKDYNFFEPKAVTDLTLTCQDSNGANPVSHTFSTSQNINVCRTFTIASSDHGGLVGTATAPGLAADTTPVSYATPGSLIKKTEVVNLTLTENASTNAYTCTYMAGTSPSTDNEFSVSPGACP